MDRTFERHVVVAGLLRLNNGVLLMRQRGPADTHDRWTLPNGEANPGELLTEALTRMLEASIGLCAQQIGPSVCMSQLTDTQHCKETLFVVLELSEWTGKMEARDPEGQTREMGFFHADDAIRKLHGAGPRAMYEPVETVLKSDAPSGALWLYRDRGDGHEMVYGPGLTQEAEVRI